MGPSGIVEQPSWQAEEGAERTGARSAGKWERCGETERFYEHVTFSSANGQSRSRAVAQSVGCGRTNGYEESRSAVPQRRWCMHDRSGNAYVHGGESHGPDAARRGLPPIDRA